MLCVISKASLVYISTLHFVKVFDFYPDLVHQDGYSNKLFQHYIIALGYPCEEGIYSQQKIIGTFLGEFWVSKKKNKKKEGKNIVSSPRRGSNA